MLIFPLQKWIELNDAILWILFGWLYFIPAMKLYSQLFKSKSIWSGHVGLLLFFFFYIWWSSISIRKVEALSFTIIPKLNTTFSKKQKQKCHKFEWFDSAERNWFACKLKSIQFRIPTFMLIHIKYIEIRIYHATAVFNPLNLNEKNNHFFSIPTKSKHL